MSSECVTVWLTRETDDGEVEVEVDVRVYEAVGASGPTYSCGGMPAEPAHGEVEWAELLDGKRTPVDLTPAEERKAIERALEDFADV